MNTFVLYVCLFSQFFMVNALPATTNKMLEGIYRIWSQQKSGLMFGYFFGSAITSVLWYVLGKASVRQRIKAAAATYITIEGRCVSCWEPSDVIVLPCGHKCWCALCYTDFALKSVPHVCPMCRGPIDSVKYVLNSHVE